MSEQPEVRLDDLLDGAAGPLLCKWCAQEVYLGVTRGQWHHEDTGSQICSGQVAGSWNDLHRAEPLDWTIAE